MTTLKQAAKIEGRIRRHILLMNEFMAQGLSREEASSKAYKIITGKR